MRAGYYRAVRLHQRVVAHCCSDTQQISSSQFPRANSGHSQLVPLLCQLLPQLLCSSTINSPLPPSPFSHPCFCFATLAFYTVTLVLGLTFAYALLSGLSSCALWIWFPLLYLGNPGNGSTWTCAQAHISLSASCSARVSFCQCHPHLGCATHLKSDLHFDPAWMTSTNWPNDAVIIC